MRKLDISNRVIVVCSQNFNGYGVLRSLSKVGIKPLMITNHNKKNPIIYLSRLRGRIDYYDRISDIPEILLSRYSDKNGIQPVVICCDDALQSVVDCHYDKLSPHFILSNIGGTQGEITRLMDQNLQMRVAQECGITVPRTWELPKGADILSDITYPCIVKAQWSIHGSKDEMQICSNEYELKKNLTHSGHLVQQFIDKDYEIIIYGTSIGTGKYYMPGVTHKIRQYPDNNGMSSFCVLEGFDKHPNLDKTTLERFLQKLNYTGMFSIEMAVKDGKYYLLEINLRNDGKQYFSTAAGANLPSLYIHSRLQRPIALPDPQYPTFAMGELTDFYQINRLPGFTFGKWIRDLLRTDSFFILNCLDPLPGLSDCHNLLRFKARGLLKKIGFNIS